MKTECTVSSSDAFLAALWLEMYMYIRHSVLWGVHAKNSVRIWGLPKQLKYLVVRRDLISVSLSITWLSNWLKVTIITKHTTTPIRRQDSRVPLALFNCTCAKPIFVDLFFSCIAVRHFDCFFNIEWHHPTKTEICTAFYVILWNWVNMLGRVLCLKIKQQTL